MNAITPPAPAPQPKQRRRKRSDDTRGLFKKLAIKVVIPAVTGVIFALGDFNCFAPPEPLDETQRRLMRDRNAQQWQHNQAFRQDRSSYLSPRL